MTDTQQADRHLTAVPTIFERPPLHDEAAERIVLGAMMLNADVADQITDIVTSADFYRPRNAIIFAAITGTLATGDPADPIAIARALASTGELERCGGASYLHDVYSAPPTAAQGPFYARIVADWGSRRRLQVTAVRLEQLSGDLTRDVSDIIEDAQNTVHQATVTKPHTEAHSYTDLLDPTIAEILDPNGPKLGLPTGLADLDHLTGGFRPGQLIIVGARPGCGKSVLLTGFMRTAALRHGLSAALYSLEMSEKEVMRRLLSAECRIPMHVLTHMRPSAEDAYKLRNHAAQVKAAPLWIDDAGPLDLPSLRSRARRIQQRHGLDIIAVDYLQLMSSTGRKSNRAEEIAEISRGLKLLAGDLGVPIIAAAQLNRQSEQRTDRRPQLSDLRESGSIEADADIVILLHRADLHDPETPRAGEIDLIIAKNRSGPTDVITAAAQLHISKIVDMAIV